MATRTALELATNVLLDWGIIPSDDTASAADVALIIRRYQNILEEFAEDGLAYWDYNAIPTVIFEPLTQIMALVVARSFGKPVPAADMEAGMQIFKRRLRRHAHVVASGEPTRVENY